MKTDYKRIILVTGGLTLLALLVAGLIIFLLLFFVFTKDLAKFCYYIGSYDIAGSLYSRVYKQDGGINNCYLALTIDIRTDDYDGVVKNYELFIEDAEYEKFMNRITISNQIVAGGVLERSALVNEYQYLEDRYILALIKTRQSTKAFDRAVEMFSGYEGFDLETQGYYSLNRFVNDDNIHKFDDEYVGYDSILVDSMQEYYNSAVEMFNAGKTTNDVQVKAQVVALGNRLILVGQNINTIYTKLSYNTDLIQGNLDSMTMMNETIKGLI